MTENGTADLLSKCSYYSTVQDNWPFTFSRSCLVFNVLVHTHVESQQISLDSCLSLKIAATGLQKEVTGSTALCNKRSGIVFYLLHGAYLEIEARNRLIYTAIFFFFFRATTHRLRSKLSNYSSFVIRHALPHACSIFDLLSILLRFSTLGN